LLRALKHLHAIGQIVLFGDQKICTKPSVISQLMAKFISPTEVRNGLFLKSDKDPVNLLTKTNIDCILGLNKSILHDEISLMTFFGVCYELQTHKMTPSDAKQQQTLYLFPSLGEKADLQFTMAKEERFQLVGVQVIAAGCSVFVPGILCQLMVAICKTFCIYQHEIRQVVSNGMIFVSPGILDGQILIFTDPQGDSKSIMFVMMGSNPDVNQICSIFQDMISTHFPNYIGYETEHLCCKCIEVAFLPNHVQLKEHYLLGNNHSKYCINDHHTIIEPLVVNKAQKNMLDSQHG
jgi:hypothetical protein